MTFTVIVIDQRCPLHQDDMCKWHQTQFKQIFVEAIIFENVQIFDDFQIFEMIRDEKCDCPLPLTGKFCERAELVQVGPSSLLSSSSV